MKKALAVTCFICATLCIAYFGVLVGYSGLQAAFIFVWILFALLFAAMGFFLGNGNRHKDAMPAFLPTFIYTSFGLAVTAFIATMVMVVSASHSNVEGSLDYCVVMGARVYSNGISKTLMYRLDEAAELYEKDQKTVIVLAGGKDQGDAIPEAFAMYNYLVMKDVPNESMLMEARAISTVGIIRGASKLIRADADKKRIPKGPGEIVWSQEYEPSVGIITSDFHMFRSLAIARQNGMYNVYAVPAKSDSVLFVHNCVRESMEIILDFFMGNVIIDESIK